MFMMHLEKWHLYLSFLDALTIIIGAIRSILAKLKELEHVCHSNSVQLDEQSFVLR